MNELRGLRDTYQQFRELDANIVAVSNEPQDVSQALVRKIELPFPILADTNQNFLTQLGMLHTGAKGDSDAARPGTYVIDRTGQVAWMQAANRIRTRPDPADVLAAVRSAR